MRCTETRVFSRTPNSQIEAQISYCVTRGKGSLGGGTEHARGRARIEIWRSRPGAGDPAASRQVHSVSSVCRRSDVSREWTCRRGVGEFVTLVDLLLSSLGRRSEQIEICGPAAVRLAVWGPARCSSFAFSKRARYEARLLSDANGSQRKHKVRKVIRGTQAHRGREGSGRAAVTADRRLWSLLIQVSFCLSRALVMTV